MSEVLSCKCLDVTGLIFPFARIFCLYNTQSCPFRNTRMFVWVWDFHVLGFPSVPPFSRTKSNIRDLVARISASSSWWCVLYWSAFDWFLWSGFVGCIWQQFGRGSKNFQNGSHGRSLCFNGDWRYWISGHKSSWKLPPGISPIFANHSCSKILSIYLPCLHFTVLSETSPLSTKHSHLMQYSLPKIKRFLQSGI